MAKEQIVADDIMTPDYRVQYPQVFSPRIDPKKPTEKGKFTIVMIWEKTDDIMKVKQNVADVLVKKFGADKTKWPPFGDGSGQVQLPLHDGASKQKPGFGEGTVFASAWSYYKPRVVDQQVTDIINPSEFYAGCYAHSKIHAFWWEYLGKMGVSFNLGNTQKVKDGEPLGGGSDPKDDFDSIALPGAAAAGTTVGGADPLGL